MSEIRCECTFDLDRIPAQRPFRNSKATVRGYGGAMGGGKTRSLCEEVFDWMLEYPGIVIPVCRQVHTHITGSTRKTFWEQVLPPELRARSDLIRTKQSAGDDFIEFLWNGSVVHFVGLDKIDKWLSSEIGAVCFDEAHEIAEQDVLFMNSRLRQRCADCMKHGWNECSHMPHRMILTFNPSFPGHWLQHWFMFGAQSTEWGYRKEELVATDGDAPIGDAEYFVASPRQNPFLPPDYITKKLAGLSKMQRRRYLDGLWEHPGGSFFDDDALAEASMAAAEHAPLMVCEPRGDLTGSDQENLPHLITHGKGRMEIFAKPVRLHTTRQGDEVKAHRYVVSVDASTGASSDWSAVQVVDVEELEQVAEWQGKVDPDRLAELAFLTACVYNGALLAPEITGGWGFSATHRIRALIGGWRGPKQYRPMLYTRPAIGRISDGFTDLLGWDTNIKTRALMLDALEQTLRDGSLRVHGRRTLAECAAFAVPDRVGGVGDYRSPRAQKGANDDLVISLAIATYVSLRLPKNLRAPRYQVEEPWLSVTGY